jgi:threonine/homoserine/homoserine lactone efflux protein
LLFVTYLFTVSALMLTPGLDMLLRSSSSSLQGRTSPHSRSRQPIRGGV